jgi:hypothetical protein
MLTMRLNRPVGALRATAIAGYLLAGPGGAAPAVDRASAAGTLGATARADLSAPVAGREAASWSAPESLGASDVVDDTPPAIALAARGDAVAVWAEGRLEGGSPVYSIHAAVRPSSGHWQAPSTLAQDGLNPLVALDGAGDAVTAWESSSGVPVALRPANAVWSVPASVDSVQAGEPQVASDARGDSLVVWERQDPDRSEEGRSCRALEYRDGLAPIAVLISEPLALDGGSRDHGGDRCVGQREALGDPHPS